jgi:hypothetical protein
LAKKGLRRAFIEVNTLRDYRPETHRPKFDSIEKNGIEASCFAKSNNRCKLLPAQLMKAKNIRPLAGKINKGRDEAD